MTITAFRDFSSKFPPEGRLLSSTILERIADGEQSAVEECLNCYGGLVWSLARKFLHSDVDAEDATQEIFVEIWQQAAKFQPEKASEPTFITMIARRRLIDRLRRAKSGPEVTSMNAESLDIAEILDNNSIELQDEAAKAAECLKKLSADQQTVLKLSIHNCISHAGIAATLKIPLGTVKSFARRGLLQMRECMNRSATSQFERVTV